MRRNRRGDLVPVKPGGMMKLRNDATAVYFSLAVLFVCTDGTDVSAAPVWVATVTETKNEVLYTPEVGEERPAKVSDKIQGEDVLRTGERSLAEIEFEDKTITRLGSKSVFTFSRATREFRLGKGLTLICMPKGTGGGRLVSSAISASIEGTTVIAQEIEIPSEDPGEPLRRVSKMIFLEGNGRIFPQDGKQAKPIRAGQMIMKFQDDPRFPDPVEIDVAALLAGSGIINKFSRPLPTIDKIKKVIERQKKEQEEGGTEQLQVTDPIYRDPATIEAFLLSVRKPPEAK